MAKFLDLSSRRRLHYTLAGPICQTRRCGVIRTRCLMLVVLLVLSTSSGAQAESPRQVLLLGAKRDHPPGRHHYQAGLRILAKCLAAVPGLKTELVAADEPWPEGPGLLQKANGVVLFLGEGAKWLRANPERTAAMQELARRGGGIVALHAGIMTKDAQYIEPFRSLVGGCHGGPDRRYVFLDNADVRVADRSHPICEGLSDLRINDEFYFKLKFASHGSVQPILQVPIEGQLETVAWAYERPDGGRSFGFSGADPHANWQQVAYRRLAAQAVLWTLKLPVPKGGLPVRVADEDLRVPESE